MLTILLHCTHACWCIYAWVQQVQVPAAVVDALHRQYYDAVVSLFTRHKDSFPGYESVSLAVETS